MSRLFEWFYKGIITFVTIIPRYFLIGLFSIIDPKKANKFKYKGKPIIPIIVLCITISTYLICIFVISRWYVQKLKLDFLIKDIVEATNEVDEYDSQDTIDKFYQPNESNDKYANISFMNKDFTELLSRNPDTVGWIKVNNTKVDYSVVQYTDNKFYLKHDFSKRSNYNGWVYADYRNDFKYFNRNNIIYAHNLTNRQMFGSLVWCLKDSWYKNEENMYIKLSTPVSNTVWKIFSIYTIIPESYYIKTQLTNDDFYEKFIKTITERSIYDFNEEVTTDDKLLTLSTCTDDGTKRVVIHSKMIKIEYK